MKLTRLLGIVTLLLQRDHVTAPELAERFEVSRRTISRDVEALCEAGLPVMTVQGYGGGISLSRAYSLNRSLLTRAEAQALIAAVRALSGVSALEDPQSLLDKLPQAGKGGAMEVDLSAFHGRTLSEKIKALRDAMDKCRLVSFSYSAPGGESLRRAEPCRLLYRYSSWYLFAYCLGRQDFRLFKLDRISGLQILEEHFTPRSVAPEQEPFSQYFAEDQYQLRAVFDPSVRYRLVEEYGPEGFAERADGLYAELSFSSYAWMRGWVLSFGDRVRVLAPQELRRDLAGQARKMAEMYPEDELTN